jgi:RNA polymerase primary sigma factor
MDALLTIEKISFNTWEKFIMIPNRRVSNHSAKEKHSIMLNRILTLREKRVISLRFGFGTGNALTLDQVGKSMSLTRERIRQIEAKALNKLRSHPRLKFMKDYLN